MKKAVDFGDGSAGNDGNSTIQTIINPAQQADHLAINVYKLRTRRKSSQRAIEIEKESTIGLQTDRISHVHNLRHKTEKSTPAPDFLQSRDGCLQDVTRRG
ncbi:hypothetical protein [Pannonibacter phragmitetus]|uniref:hypothetical protein n=1 Tax=Pannonibacter phragmitetus TaxID=121719 RepID=UPI003D2F3BA7